MAALPMAESRPQAREGPARGAVTARSLAAGIAVGVLVILWNTYVEYIAHTARMNITHFPLALFIPFTVLSLVNGILRRNGLRWALSPSEMLVVVALGLVAAAVPAYGLTSFFLGLIAIPYYLATPENQWGSHFHQYLPDWLIPSNDGDAMRWLFEGLPSPDMPVPWGVWLVPLSSWMVFIGTVVLGSICLAVMLRKQWAQHERLAYPILHPARDLAESGEGEASLLKNRLLWVGAALPFFILSWNIISYFSPGFPRISLYRGWMPVLTNFPSIHINVNWYTVGFAYFANVEVLFSIWVFYLFYWVQVGIYRRLGINLSRSNMKGDPTVSYESAGAFLAMILWGLWLTRSHLRDVFTKAFRPSHPVDDSGELLSYRACAFGFILSVVFIVFWLNALGIAFSVAAVLTAGLFLSYIGIARIIAETGVVYYSMNLSGHGMVNFTFNGPNGFDPSTKTALRITDAISCQGKGMFMPPLVHVAKLGDEVGAHRRRLTLGVGLMLVTGIGAAIIYSLHLGYAVGAYNFNDYPFTRYPLGVYNGLVKALKGEVTWETESYYFLAAGAVIYAVVSAMRYRFTWWPLTPIGMMVPMTHAIHSIFSIFLTWAGKILILRLGGVNLYRKCRPVFIGFLVGHALGCLLSYLVDQVWFPGQGHGTHSW